MLELLFQGGESVFEKWWNSLKTAIQSADPVEVWAWILIFMGFMFLFMVIFFTEYKRQERESVKFTVISIIVSALCLGFGFDLLLMSNGIW